LQKKFFTYVIPLSTSFRFLDVWCNYFKLNTEDSNTAIESSECQLSVYVKRLRRYPTGISSPHDQSWGL